MAWKIPSLIPPGGWETQIPGCGKGGQSQYLFGMVLARALSEKLEEAYHREGTESTEEGLMEEDPFTAEIIGCAIEVHRALAPGLLESTYKQCLAHELHLNGIPFRLPDRPLGG